MWTCQKCQEKIEDSFDACWNCGTSQEGVENPDFHREETRLPEGRLHFLAYSLSWMFYLLALMSLGWGSYHAMHGDPDLRAGIMLVTIASVITSLGMAEILGLLIQIEENTRTNNPSDY